ncbi:OmpA/MotB family protein [Prosthecomicrobium sp. N25]|uniref:OmpA/MotB family protein n=1 Tax=Prosthecomicrobium sp. N25 TaxID=3129254 RepID=UPI0030787576
MARRKKAHGGGHGWFVTFADLMGLLMAFFVVVAAFSTQDKAKLMALLGSMREAFGTTRDPRLSGMIELDGLPVREHAKSVSPVPTAATDWNKADGGPGARPGGGTPSTSPYRFDGAVASIRQALAAMPDIARPSERLVLHEDEKGLHIELVDQDGRSMFPAGSDRPLPQVADILRAVAPTLRQLPNGVAITGHTTSTGDGPPNQSTWELSTARAHAVRRLLEQSGLPRDRVAAVIGKADQEPYFPEGSFSANRRVTILLLAHAPPLPAGFGLDGADAPNR